VLVYNITTHHSSLLAVLAVKPLSRIRTIRLSYKIQVSWCGTKYLKCPWMESELLNQTILSAKFEYFTHALMQSVYWLKPLPFLFTDKHSMNTVSYTQRPVKQNVIPLAFLLWCVNFQDLWSLIRCCKLRQWQTCHLQCYAVLQLQNDVTLPGLVCNSILKLKL
jgi:hypothetical protein